MVTIPRVRDERAASAVEYSFLVAAIAAVIVMIAFAIGAFTGELFADTCASLDGQSSLTAAGDC